MRDRETKAKVPSLLLLHSEEFTKHLPEDRETLLHRLLSACKRCTQVVDALSKSSSAPATHETK